MMIDRRRFLEFLSWAAAAGTLTPRTALAAATSTGFREIRNGVGYFWGRGGTIGWLISQDAIAVVDSQFMPTARILLEGIQQRSKHPVDVLFNTHHHPDHTSGNAVFRGVTSRIIAQRNVPALQQSQARTNNTLDDQVYANEIFADESKIQLGAHEIKAKYFGPAHTSGDAIIHFVDAQVVHLGDLVFNRWHPLIDAPHGASVRGWLSVLEKIHTRFDKETVFIFGHGAEAYGRTGTLAEVARQRDYFHALLETAEKAVHAGRSRQETISLKSLPGFEEYVSVGERLSLAWCLGVAWDELAGQRR